MFKGLRSLIHETNDLAAAKRWIADAVGVEPYFDEPFYIGFEIGGHELGLLPVDGPPGPARAYWGVDDLAAELARLEAAGGRRLGDPDEVGEGIVMVRVQGPHGIELGLIQNPHDPT